MVEEPRRHRLRSRRPRGKARIGACRLMIRPAPLRRRFVLRIGTDGRGRAPGCRAPTLILEVARFDEQLVSRFHLLTRRPGELAVPPVFVAFDWLWSRGRDLRGLP